MGPERQQRPARRRDRIDQADLHEPVGREPEPVRRDAQVQEAGRVQPLQGAERRDRKPHRHARRERAQGRDELVEGRALRALADGAESALVVEHLEDRRDLRVPDAHAPPEVVRHALAERLHLQDVRAHRSEDDGRAAPLVGGRDLLEPSVAVEAGVASPRPDPRRRPGRERTDSTPRRAGRRERVGGGGERGEERLEGRGERAGRGEAARGLLREGAAHDHVEGGGDAGSDRAGRRGLLLQNPAEELQLVVLVLEGRATGQQIVEDGAERVQVGLGLERAPEDLLGRHVRAGAQDGPAPRDHRARVCVGAGVRGEGALALEGRGGRAFGRRRAPGGFSGRRHGGFPPICTLSAPAAGRRRARGSRRGSARAARRGRASGAGSPPRGSGGPARP